MPSTYVSQPFIDDCFGFGVSIVLLVLELRTSSLVQMLDSQRQFATMLAASNIFFHYILLFHLCLSHSLLLSQMNAKYVICNGS